MQFNLLDYIILAIIFISILNGLRLGFIKAITSIVNTVLAIILGFLLYDKVLIYLNHYFNIQTKLTKFIYNKFPVNAFSIDFPLLKDPILISLTKLNNLAETFSYYIMIVISFFIIFLFSKFILGFLTYVLDGLFSISLLSWINKLLGMLILPAKNLLILMVLLGLTYPAIELASQIGISGALIVFELIEGSIIADKLLNCFDLIKTSIIV